MKGIAFNFMIIFGLLLTACNIGGQQESANIKITLHDSLVGTENINRIDITILRTEIITDSGEKIILSEETQKFNLLDLTANNPVLLANTSIKPGTYAQIRLILDNNSSITFTDATKESLKVPSSEQSGIKIDGIFSIPAGKFYTLDIDLIPAESIHYTKGQGYIMKPVIEISGSDIISGNFYYSGYYGDDPFTLNLQSDGSVKALYGAKPNYIFYGTYNHDTVKQTATVTPTSVKCPSCDIFENIALENAEMPAPITYNVKTFSENTITLTDPSAQTITLQKSTQFALVDKRIPNEKFTLSIDLNDSSYKSKVMAISLIPDKVTSQTGKQYYSVAEIDSNSTAIYNLDLSGYDFTTGVATFSIVAFIVDNITDIKTGINSIGINSNSTIRAHNFNTYTTLYLDTVENNYSIKMNIESIL